MLPAEAFAGHPEIIGPAFGIFVGAVARPPVPEGCLACVFELVPAREFDMFGRVASEAVDAEIFYPCGKPVDYIVGRGSLAARSPCLGVGQTVIVIVAPFLSLPFLK